MRQASDTALLELLDEVGGNVAPAELDDQLARRGLRANRSKLVGLVRDSLLAIEPAGYTLTAEALRRLRPPVSAPPSPPTKAELARRFVAERSRVTARDLFLAGLACSVPAARNLMHRLKTQGAVVVLEQRPAVRPGGHPAYVYGPAGAEGRQVA